MLDLVFLVCAVLGSTIVVAQFALTLMGIVDDGGGDLDLGVEADGGLGDGDLGDGDLGDGDLGDAEHSTKVSQAADADVDHVSSSWLFKMLSVRSILAAIAFFGLGGLGARSTEMGHLPSLAIASAAGFAAMYGVYWLMQQLHKLRASGTVNIANAHGKPATIYVPIPPANEGRGKVQITLQGRTMEYEAVTNDELRLMTGENVIVEEVLSGELVRVTRASEPAIASV